MSVGGSGALSARQLRRDLDGYRMLDSIEVRNFRGFESLDITDLRRINVVAGANAAGKTALLEAIVLGLRAVPGVFGQLMSARGMQAVMPMVPGLPFTGTGPFVALAGSGAEQFRAMVNGLFHNYKTNNPIEIRYIDNKHQTFEAKFSYDLSGGEMTTLTSQPGSIPFRIERSKNGSQEVPIVITVGPGGQMQHAAVNTFLGPDVMFFPSYTFHAEWDNVGWFSALSQQNREKEVISIVRDYFPAIKSLSILSPPSQAESIWADLGSKKLPVSMVSSGLHRFISILLGMISVESGIIVIDEIENGLYYRLYPKIWKLILDMAVKNKNQIFVSTHSLECLRALGPAIKQRQSDVCMLRVTQSDGDSVVHKVSGDSLMAGLTGNVELRG